MVVVAAVVIVTAADWAAGGRCLSWLGRGGGKVVAAPVDFVTAAEEAE